MNLCQFCSCSPTSVTCTPPTCIDQPPLPLLLLARYLIFDHTPWHKQWGSICTPHVHLLQYMHGTPTTGPTVPHKTPACLCPHTLVRAVRSKLYSSIRSWTTSAWPSWAAKCSMVNPRLLVLWSRDCIFGARYWIVLIWPPYAAQWRAFCPS